MTHDSACSDERVVLSSPCGCVACVAAWRELAGDGGDGGDGVGSGGVGASSHAAVDDAPTASGSSAAAGSNPGSQSSSAMERGVAGQLSASQRRLQHTSLRCSATVDDAIRWLHYVLGGSGVNCEFVVPAVAGAPGDAMVRHADAACNV
jgi:hypothetical protein